MLEQLREGNNKSNPEGSLYRMGKQNSDGLLTALVVKFSRRDVVSHLF